MKNCDSCVNFSKVNHWMDGRKGLCYCTDYNIVTMKGKPCIYHRHKKYNRQPKHKIKEIVEQNQ
jgi:hypothetical protein